MSVFEDLTAAVQLMEIIVGMRLVKIQHILVSLPTEHEAQVWNKRVYSRKIGKILCVRLSTHIQRHQEGNKTSAAASIKGSSKMFLHNGVAETLNDLRTGAPTS